MSGDLGKDSLTYILRESYHEGWEYNEQKELSRRDGLGKDEEDFVRYLPASEKEKRIYYRIKYTTNSTLKHLFTAFETQAKQLLKWKEDTQLEEGLVNLIQKPDSVPELKDINSRKKTEFMNIVEQIGAKKDLIMSTPSEIPSEFGEELKINDFCIKGDEQIYDKLQLSDSDQEEVQNVSNAPEQKKEEKVKESGLPTMQPKEETKNAPQRIVHDIKDFNFPEKKEEKDKSKTNLFKAIIEKHLKANNENVDIIFRILEIIKSKATELEIQEEVIGLLGYTKMEMLQELIENRSNIQSYLKDALKAIKYNKNNPTHDDILVLLQILGFNLGNIQARPQFDYRSYMQEETVVSSGIYGGDATREESKAFVVQKYKAAERNDHKDIKKVSLSAFPDWAQVI